MGHRAEGLTQVSYSYFASLEHWYAAIWPHCFALMYGRRGSLMLILISMSLKPGAGLHEGSGRWAFDCH